MEENTEEKKRKLTIVDDEIAEMPEKRYRIFFVIFTNFMYKVFKNTFNA